MDNFNSLRLADWILKLCKKIGYRQPTPIQSLAIQPILLGRNVIEANAETGSGKTAAFAFPLLHRLSRDPYSVFCLIVTPSRQLAIQIHDQLSIFGQSLNLRMALLIGGINFDKQQQQIDLDPHIVVGTPGRIMHMIRRNDTFNKCMKNCQVLVLDEADRLFEDTLLIEMQSIMKELPNIKQFVLATATIDNNFQANVLKQILQRKDINFEKCSTYSSVRVVPTLVQKFILVPETIKSGYLLTLLKNKEKCKLIIFVKTCKQCHLVHNTLKKLNFKSCLLHSFMKQTRRQANLRIFQTDSADILVTTDLASRGLDIKAVDLVVNYEIPRKLSDYVHRVGRTARKGLEGEAVTFVTQNQVELFLKIEKQVVSKMDEEKLNERQAIQNFKIFSKALRQAKLELSNKGVLEQLDHFAERKKKNRQQLKQQQ